jgi:glutaredoxin
MATTLTATVYSTSHCTACVAASNWLLEQGCDVVVKSAYDAPFMVWSVPTIVIGNSIVTGFDRKKLAEILGRYEK